MPMPRSRRSVIIVFLLFSLVVSALLVLIVLRTDTPEVIEVTPREFQSGDVMTIRGTSFGDARGQSYVSIAGRRVTASGYLSWSDSEIRLRVPDFSVSGLLVVHTARDQSAGLLVRHRDDVPQALETAPRQQIRFDRFQPGEPAVGDVVEVHGRNFGNVRHGRMIVFSGAAGTPVHAREEDIELWSDRVIRLRVPDGATSGPVSLDLPGSDFALGELEVRTPGAVRQYGEPVPLALELFARFTVSSSAVPTDLWLWWPAPRGRQAQSAFEVISAHAPDALVRRSDMTLLEWRNESQPHRGVRQTVRTSRAPVAFEFVPAEIRSTYDRSSSTFQRYTARHDRYAMDETQVNTAARAVFVQNNPLTTARRAFDAAVRDIAFDPEGPEDVVSALEEGRGTSEAISRYMTGLLRLSLVPARVVRGVRVTSAGSLPLYSWVEFLLPGIGWVPADAAAAAGADAYYFGEAPDNDTRFVSGFARLDARRIELGAGHEYAVRLRPESAVIVHPAGLTQSSFHAEWISGDATVDLTIAPVSLLEMPDVFRLSRPAADPPADPEG